MAQVDRKYVEDVTVWSANGQEFLTRLKDATMNEESATRDNAALKDAAEWPMPAKKKYTVDFSEAVEGATALRCGTSYTVIANDGTETWTGPALLTSRSSSIGEDGVSRKWQFAYQGVPVIT